MQKPYTPLQSVWLALLTLLLLAAARPAAAQSGPYGNEWIVPGQTYYKIKITRTGLYRLDYQYLTQAGISGVDPSRLQLWRRGREVAVYQGGTPNVFDANTYLEFYGQRNDGVLDADYYKRPADQPHQYYSFSTDTAAYFITYGVGAATAPGRRMAQPVATGSTPHPYRLLNIMNLNAGYYVEVPVNYTYLPWLEKGEGFYEPDYQGEFATFYGRPANAVTNTPADTALRAILPSPAPRMEMLIVGNSQTPSTATPVNSHNVQVRVTNTGVPARVLGTASFTDFNYTKVQFPLLRSDITAAGRLTLYVNNLPGATYREKYSVGYSRLIAPQANRWFSNHRWLLFQNDSLLGGPATYELDSIPATVWGYDVHDPWNVQRVEPTAATTLGPLGRRFVFPSATAQQTRWLFLADVSRALTPAPARRVQFRTINPTTPNYLIVTHRKLMGPVPGLTNNAALEYARYRASAAGGGYDTLMVTSQQLYDQFHYGERSVLALRHFALWMAANATPARPKYLLLLGKALQPNAQVGPITNFRLTPVGYTTRELGELGLDLVPCSSRSVSDNWLSSDFRNSDYVARLPTGRVVASTPQHVMDYLAKVKAHELPQPLQAWRKHALNLVGGEDASDFLSFGLNMAGYKKRIERPCFAGQVVQTYSRSTVGAFDDLPVNIKIDNELNAGLSLITYFGHGSNTAFDLNLGDASDPSNNYNNTGKYPMLFYNGCAASNLFGNYNTFGENWLLTPNRGAIGLMGETGFGFPDPLDLAQDTLYSLLLNSPQWYGKPVTVVHNEAVRRLQTTPQFVGAGADVAAEQLLATLWHGDPALKLYAPALPDFQTSTAQLAIAPAPPEIEVTAASAKFLLNIGVANPGNFCTRTDSLEIRVTRSYGNPARPTPDVYIKKFKLKPQLNAVYTDTLTNVLRGGVNVFGTNTFLVELDYRNREPELDELNNSARIDYTFLENGVTILSPPEFAILPSNAPRLVAQANIASGTARDYILDLDTVATFTSPTRHQQTTISSTSLIDWRPTLPAIAGRDSVVWYWRVRSANPIGTENPDGVRSSFRVVGNGAGGWSQSHYSQLRRDLRQGVEVSVPTGQWSFTEERQGLRLRTGGGGLPRAAPNFFNGQGFGILTDVGNTPALLNCAPNSPNFMVVVYDQHTLQPKRVPGSWDVCGNASQQFYIFATDPTVPADTLNNIHYPVRQAQFRAFLNTVTDGDYVALVSMNRVRWQGLQPLTIGQLATLLGSNLVSQLRNGDPLALLAQKRSTGGRLLREVGPDLSLVTPPRYNQIVTLTDTLRTPSSKGKVISTRIGPAQQWQTLYSWITKASATSSYVLKVQGIDTAQVVHDLPAFANVVGGRTGLSLSSIAAAQYPYLQLQLTLSDSLNRVAPQLHEWFITYKGVPEGIVRRDLVVNTQPTAYDPATLAGQAADPGTIRFPVKFENVSTVDFGSPLRAKVELLGSNVAPLTFTLPRPLKADSIWTLNVAVPVIGQFGTFTPKVTVNPTSPGRPLPELYHFNNELTLPPFAVVDHNVPPTLDVAVDGRHILNGELVSPTPAIRVQLRDEDKLRHVTDVSYFTVLLKRPGAATYETINLLGGGVQFRVDNTAGSVATLDIQPDQGARLADGVYTLRVQGRDPSSASVGNTEFEVKFEVVNASTITNVFPYPNPVVDKARFVFTVTGVELPRNMKIQIMTLTGAVVREIFMSELGPLHIGNNLTDYAWDGKDQYGDRLANGTYLYRVSLDDPNGQFSQRRTAADQAFKNDWGKLVLMR